MRFPNQDPDPDDEYEDDDDDCLFISLGDDFIQCLACGYSFEASRAMTSKCPSCGEC